MPEVEDLKIHMAIQEATDRAPRTLVIGFNKQISWLSFDKEQAVKFAEEFLKRVAML